MSLPAIAAVAAVAAIPTASTATTTAIPTAPAATAPTITTSAATAAGALGLRTGFVDDKVPATEVLTVEAIDGAIRIFIVGDLDESETTGLPREAVANQTDC